MRSLRTPILRTKAQRLAAFCLLFTLMLIPTDLLYDKAAPLIAECAASAARARISETIGKCAAEFDTDELVIIGSNEGGIITNLRTDTASINAIKATFTRSLTESLKKKSYKIGVPIGDIIGIPASIGRGPALPIRITGYTAAVTDINSEFISAGLNQTLHRITMTVTVECTLLLPRLQTKKLSVTSAVPLSETVIIGDVPSYLR